ncbi:MAG TPA: hypothetical protein VKV29_00440 [Chthonomonas sp.]|jgi:hypothetical protein|uniref:hypothetical protein n=1 Tax=Chthonomonas sp. TaxID=2282153 RepID=UPI002B4AE332|nr:hypothetical protein [Chthonomonas sp.]HLH78731.1 hypothetical protein [Chthonomonas sp.]
MPKTLVLEVPNEVYQALQQEAAKTGKAPEQLAAEWLALQSNRGKAEALRPFFGAWQMAPDERAHIEKMLDEERHLEEDAK